MGQFTLVFDDARYNSTTQPPRSVSILCGTGKDGKGKPKKFRFDRVFTPSNGQEEVFSDTKHLVRSSIDG